MNTSLAEDHEEVKPHGIILSFMKRFEIMKCFNEAGIKKEKGYALKEVVLFMIGLVFTNKTFYALMKICNFKKPFDKDVVYRFLDNPWSNWRLCLLKIAALVINNHLYGLTNSERVRALVLDDSFFDRSRSSKVELLAWVKNHTTGITQKGFRFLTLGWTDGVSFIPLMFSLLSSSEKKMRICEADTDIPPESSGAARRKEAVSSAIDVSLVLIDEAMKHVRCFKYVLFDSWFPCSRLILGIKSRGRDVICMLKENKTLYGYKERAYKLQDLFSVVEKTKANKDDILASAVVYYFGMRVRIVFVRNRDKGAKRKWLALLSTDLSISPEEIIRIYGMRWDIEVFFKMSKSFLKLAKEFRVRSYDSMIAHTSIVCIRNILLSYESRFNQDNRSYGGIYYECCDEVAEISLSQSFKLIMDLLVKTLHETPFLSDEEVDQILERLITNIPSILRERLLGRAA
ncbi:MAG: IS4 family transposase [Desulfomonilaceae bacterium]